MTLELTVDQFERIDNKLTHILAEAGEARTEAALQRQELGHVQSQLQRLAEDVRETQKRITTIEKAHIELRGAWKVISAMAAAIGAAAHWIAGRLH